MKILLIMARIRNLVVVMAATGVVGSHGIARRFSDGGSSHDGGGLAI